MSYDLVLWRGATERDPREVWADLAVGRPVDSLEPLTAEELGRAFGAVFSSGVRVEGPTIFGKGFEVHLEEADGYATVTCSWRLLRSQGGQRVLGRIAHAARELGAVCFDPQSAPALVDEVTETVPVDLTRVGPTRSLRGPQGLASTVEGAQAWSMPRDDAGGGARALHDLYLGHAGDAFHPRDDAHPTNVTRLEASYLWLPPALDLDVVVASAVGTVSGASVEYPRAVLGVLEGRAGFLSLGGNPYVEEDGVGLMLVSGLLLTPTGPAARRRAPGSDVSEHITGAARRALEHAHRGDTAPLRQWIVTMVAVARDGSAVVEAQRGEVPVRAAEDEPLEFEHFEEGAIMPVTVAGPRAGARYAEVRLRVTDGGFQLRVFDRGAAPEPPELWPPDLA